MRHEDEEVRSFVKDRRFAENNREKYLKRTGMMMSGPQGLKFSDHLVT